MTIIDEIQKLQHQPHKGFSDTNRVAKKMDQVELSKKRFLYSLSHNNLTIISDFS